MARPTPNADRFRARAARASDQRRSNLDGAAILVRIGQASTAHRARPDSDQRGALDPGAVVYSRTQCGRSIPFGRSTETPASAVGIGPSFLLQPCQRCEAKR